MADRWLKNTQTFIFDSSDRSVIITLGWTLKPWLDGRLFAAILGECGQRRHGRSRATGGDTRGLWISVTSVLCWPMKKATRSPGYTGRFVQCLNKLPTVAGDRVLIGKLLYHDVTLPEMTSVWRSPVSVDCRRRPIVVKWRITRQGSPIVSEKKCPCNQPDPNTSLNVRLSLTIVSITTVVGQTLLAWNVHLKLQSM